MSILIEKLKQQAGIDHNPDQEGLDIFAELIVEECIEVAKRAILSGSGVDPDTFTGTVTSAEKIKEHFKV
jgi:NTP pyrophosphatase (non-canonical NTP hydrolase)